jgi:DNA-binding MarR family transcriptional regulator
MLLFANVARRVFQDDVVERLKYDGINGVRMGMLGLLARMGKQTVNMLASFMTVSKAAASQNVEILVQNALVTRRNDPNDRRTQWVEITATGRRAVRVADRAQITTFRKVLDGLSPHVAEALAESMAELTLAMANHFEVDDEVCLQCCAFGSAACIRKPAGKNRWMCTALRNAMPMVARQDQGDTVDE